jgi:YVTN family beta-propeller protein
VPVGAYAGFRLTLGTASLKGDHGPTALVVPDVPTRIDAPFTVTAGQPVLFWLTLDYAASIADGFRFAPLFTAAIPARPIATHAALVSNSGANTITVIDKALGQAVAVIDTCGRPGGMALDHRRRQAYVACAKDDEVQSIDVAAAQVIERTRLFPGDRPRELALTPDGLTLLTVNSGSNTLGVLDALSLTRQDRISVGSGPQSVAVEPTGRRAFVFNTLSSTISVVDLASRSVVATISTDASPLRGEFNARGDRLYVIHERSPFMTVIDPRQLTLITRARVTPGLTAIKVDPIRDLIYAAGGRDAVVEFYDPNALVPVNTMKTRAGASYMAIDGEDASLYLVSPETRSVVVGSLADRKLRAEIDVGDAPAWVVVMGEK